MMEPAIEWVRDSDRLLVIGTSLNVYPAAGLVHEVRKGVPITVFDPGSMDHFQLGEAEHIKYPAGEAVPKWVQDFISE